MSPVPVERCRVLELGCGDGANLLPMAYGLPGSRFVGIDLAASAIARGQERVRALGLRNIEFACADLCDLGPELGEFDYIVAHGVYSWVPDVVRDRLLALCGAALAQDGVAFVSYNALPGGHLRTIVREMMLYDGRALAAPDQRIARARELLTTLGEAYEGGSGHRALVAEEIERTGSQTDAALLHDSLAAINRPVYFHEFAAHAATCGLQYLAEADFFEMHASVSSDALLSALDEHGDDVLAREQYLDFCKCRMFRQTLLCCAGAQLERRLSPEGLLAFSIRSGARPPTEGAELRDRSVVELRTPAGAALRTNEPLIKLGFNRLASHWPRSVGFEELVNEAREAAARPRPTHAEAIRVLGESLLRAYAANVVELHVHEPRFAVVPGEWPRASALARLQAASGETVTTLRHGSLRIEDDAGRRLIQLLDGTRDRAALVAAMAQEVGERPDLPAVLESKLADLGRLALLEA